MPRTPVQMPEKTVTGALKLNYVLLHLLWPIIIDCLTPFLADKHKMERFLRPDAPTVVSLYAPITFPPAGVLLFKQRTDGEMSRPVWISKTDFFFLDDHLLSIYILKAFCLCQFISHKETWGRSAAAVVSSQVCRTWWLPGVCLAATPRELYWRGLSLADTLSKLTDAQLLSVTCSLTEVRGRPSCCDKVGCVFPWSVNPLWLCLCQRTSCGSNQWSWGQNGVAEATSKKH